MSLPPPLAPMTPWTEAEISRFMERVSIFQRRGLTEPQAERVADRLALRDQEGDERRLCIECAALTRNGGCSNFKGPSADALAPTRHPLKYVLQRCRGFACARPPSPPPAKGPQR